MQSNNAQALVAIRSRPAIPLVGLMSLALIAACGGRAGDTAAHVDEIYAEPRPPLPGSAATTLPPAFDTDAVYDTVLHVHPAGDDASGDGSERAPFATLGRAALDARPGTRIILAAGRHAPAGSLPPLVGEPGAPIAIVGAPGAKIDGRFTSGTVSGIHLAAPRFLVIESLTIERTFPHGISIDDGENFELPAGPLVLRGLTVRQVGRGGNNDCIKLSGVADFQVLDSEFSDCNQGEAIDMVGCHRGLISANTFRKTPLTAITTKGGSADIIIHGNRFIEVTARSVSLGGRTWLPYFRPPGAPFEAARIQVVANVFYRSGDTAIAFAGCVECVVAQNTIIDPQGYVVRLLEEHPELGIGRDNRFVNNLVASSSPGRAPWIGHGRRAKPKALTVGGNLWFRPGGRRTVDPGRGYRIEAPSITGERPRFLDAPRGDYRLAPDSPGVDSGMEATWSLTPDYDKQTLDILPPTGAHAIER